MTFSQIFINNVGGFVYDTGYMNIKNDHIWEPMNSIMIVCVNIAKIIDIRFAEIMMTHLLNRFVKIDDKTFGAIIKIIDCLMNHHGKGVEEKILKATINKNQVIHEFSTLNLVSISKIAKKADEIFSSEVSDDDKKELFKELIKKEICAIELINFDRICQEPCEEPANIPDNIDKNIPTKHIPGYYSAVSVTINSDFENCLINTESWRDECIKEYVQIYENNSNGNPLLEEIMWHNKWSVKVSKVFSIPQESIDIDLIFNLLDFDPNEITKKKIYRQIIIEYAKISNKDEYVTWLIHWKNILSSLAKNPEDALNIILNHDL